LPGDLPRTPRCSERREAPSGTYTNEATDAVANDGILWLSKWDLPGTEDNDRHGTKGSHQQHFVELRTNEVGVQESQAT